MPLAQGAGGQPQVGPAAAAAAALVVSGLPTLDALLHRSHRSQNTYSSHAQVVLAAPDGSATASVYLHGATLASWSVGGRELLFVSPRAAFSPPKAIRGGVPVCFPQFGALRGLNGEG